MVRDEETGELRPASWPEALDVAARGLLAARTGGVGVLTGGRITVEDAYAYGKFARVVLSSNDVDFRARPHSAEESHFLAHGVAGTAMGPTYRELESAPAVLLLGLEPEEESPIVFLRLRKAATRGAAPLAVHSVAPWREPRPRQARWPAGAERAGHRGGGDPGDHVASPTRSPTCSPRCGRTAR